MAQARAVRPKSSTTMVRRQLGRRLRALREASGRTRADVVLTRLMSHGKLEMIEYGRTMVRPGDVYELCTLYGAPVEVTNALRELATATAQEGWWVDHARKLDKLFEVYLDLESAASALSFFEPLVVYGLFQTEEYARAVDSGTARGLDEDAIEAGVQLRIARQRAVLAPGRQVSIRAVLGEAALRLGVAGPEIMQRQYDHLHRLAGDGTVELRVLPFRAGVHHGLRGAFTILEFEDPEDPAVAYVDSYEGSRYDDQAARVTRYRQVYDDLRSKAVPLEEFPL